MANYGEDFKTNLKELKDRVIEGDSVLENWLRKALDKPLPKNELWKKYPHLEEYYNSIGNNPIDEPDLDFEIDELEKIYFNDFYIQRLKDKKGFKFDGVDYEDVKLFASKVSLKIKSYEDDNLILKKIDKFNDIDFIKIEQNSIKIAEIFKKYDDKISPIKDEYEKTIDLMLDGYDPDIDDPQEFENERMKLKRDMDKKIAEISEKRSEDIDNAICKILSVKKDDFSEWEFSLLRLNIMAMIGYIKKYKPFMKGEL